MDPWQADPPIPYIEKKKKNKSSGGNDEFGIGKMLFQESMLRDPWESQIKSSS